MVSVDKLYRIFQIICYGLESIEVFVTCKTYNLKDPVYAYFRRLFLKRQLITW